MCEDKSQDVTKCFPSFISRSVLKFRLHSSRSQSHSLVSWDHPSLVFTLENYTRWMISWEIYTLYHGLTTRGYQCIVGSVPHHWSAPGVCSFVHSYPQYKKIYESMKCTFKTASCISQFIICTFPILNLDAAFSNLDDGYFGKQHHNT